MGKKDIYTNNYFEDNERFADLVNGALHKGNMAVKPSELVSVNKEFAFANGKNTKKVTADNAKLWEKGKMIFALYSVENLSYVDYSIVIRCMLTEAFGYEKQRKKYAERIRRRTDITGDEFLSGMAKSDKYYPVIPLVVYYGTEKEWDAETSLYGLLGVKENHELSTYINNYRINLFDFHDHDSFDEFHTEVKTLFEFLRYSKDKEALYDIMDKNADRYSHVDHETGELIKVLTGNRALESYEREENNKTENKVTKTQEGGEWNMCQAFEDYRMDGVREGEARGMTIGEARGRILGEHEGEARNKINLIRKKYNKSMTVEDVADLFELDLSEVEEIYELLDNFPNEDDSELAKRLCKEELAFA